MRVIKRGRPQQGWAKEFTCTGSGNGDGGCQAKLLVEQGDLFRTQTHCRDETDTYLTFVCPLCKVWMDLTSAQASSAPLAVWSAPVMVQGRAPSGYGD